VPEDRWRAEFYSRGCLDDEKPNTKRVTFRRIATRLLGAGTIGLKDNWVWLAHPEVVESE